MSAQVIPSLEDHLLSMPSLVVKRSRPHTRWVESPAKLLPSCVNLDEFFGQSVPQFPSM